MWAPPAAAAALCVRAAGEPDARSYRAIELLREGEHFVGAGLPLGHGDAYKVLLETGDGRTLERRDPYARWVEAEGGLWCLADASGGSYHWRTPWSRMPHDELILYELQVPSFTPEGTLSAAMAKLEHVKAMGFTAVQLMPLADFCDDHSSWGYNPKQLLALAPGVGSPQDMRDFVDRAHSLGLGVIVDVVLHHGAPVGDELWNYDGWEHEANGGIYHEGGADIRWGLGWGRGWAFWKNEVYQMLEDACVMWLEEYRCDGLRFDSVNDLPREVAQRLTYALRERCPGAWLCAEMMHEDPSAVTDLGFDSVWMPYCYFDIVQQHRGNNGDGGSPGGWDIARLRPVMCVQEGLEKPFQAVQYLLGSHVQIGCQRGGAWHEDYSHIGGQHRYSVDQFGGGRADPHSRAAARLWYAANVCSSCVPLMFMGTEWAEAGWWNVSDSEHVAQWKHAQDIIGLEQKAAVTEANALRRDYAALRRGWTNMLHEDSDNGVLAFERVNEGDERVVVVINAGRGSWQKQEYGVWIGGEGGRFEEVYSSNHIGGGLGEQRSNRERGVLVSREEKLWLNLPMLSTLVLVERCT